MKYIKNIKNIKDIKDIPNGDDLNIPNHVVLTWTDEDGDKWEWPMYFLNRDEEVSYPVGGRAFQVVATILEAPVCKPRRRKGDK